MNMSFTDFLFIIGLLMFTVGVSFMHLPTIACSAITIIACANPEL